MGRDAAPTFAKRFSTPSIERLARFGYQKVTVEELPKRAGIRKDTVYLPFPSKEETVLSHIDRIVERRAANPSNPETGSC